MSRKELPVYNLTFSDPDLYGAFVVEGKYSFSPVKLLNVRGSPREICETHKVVFETPEDPTLIWRADFLPDGLPGRRGNSEVDSELRGHLEDVVAFLGFLNSSQVALGGDGRESMGDFPVYSRGSLPPFSGSSREIEQDIHHCMDRLRDREWATRFRNFFCINHFANGEKITTSEPRFISHIVIWEQIYSLIHGDSESTGLNKCISTLLNDFFGSSLEFSRRNPCVYFIIRNQFAHSGLWPISGPRLDYTPDHLKKMSFEESERYLQFFRSLTYALLLRVLEFDLPTVKARLVTNRNWYDERSFADDLEEFLASGLITS